MSVFGRSIISALIAGNYDRRLIRLGTDLTINTSAKAVQQTNAAHDAAANAESMALDCSARNSYQPKSASTKTSFLPSCVMQA